MKTPIKLLFTGMLLAASVQLNACLPPQMTGQNNNPDSAKVQTKSVHAVHQQNILYIVDGKQITAGELQKIDPSTIDSIDVFKNKKSVRLFTTENYDGVVVIKLKKK
jgi:hypothetical protein